MTLPDKEEVNNMKNKKVEKTLGDTLSKVMRRAKADDRITSGVFECASYLESFPELVMLCLMPETAPDDIAASIQHKLIEAYCLENDIQVAKISNCEKFISLLGDESPQQKSANDKPVMSPSMDCSCVLIGWPPKEKSNKHENRLMEQIWPNQIIDLPV
ncbi:growth arrest and DNA damage-inducible protein GADD45 alpha-like [Ruditapes philippinarum]|uniref:growth arrest and DNA damage-inducible protein GADD45 alpha-like n=1 Tax=Ruditapes philippinarum TaxID=129788 RepID=UPI00295A6387|nr:growth arrest and DNA damage-inducible protein GADD45 alpha-like [Ruditapes philippinarum]